LQYLLIIFLPGGCGDSANSDGLYEVLGETRFAAAAHVFIHTVAAHRDCRHDAMCANSADDGVVVAVWQTEIADQ
jgi:hypothetical protein